jgi:hypothetical protein
MKGRRALKRQRLSRANRALISEVDLKEPLPNQSKAIRDAIVDLEIDKLVNGKTTDEALKAVTRELIKIEIPEITPLPRGALPPKEEQPFVPEPEPLTRHVHAGGQDSHLTEKQVQEVVDAYQDGMAVAAICDVCRIATTTLYAILRERNVLLRGPRGPRGPRGSRKVQSPMPESAPTNDVLDAPALTEWVVTYTIRKTETQIVQAKSFNDAAYRISNRDPGIEVISVAKKAGA